MTKTSRDIVVVTKSNLLAQLPAQWRYNGGKQDMRSLEDGWFIARLTLL